jgi:hypothetical protein
MTVRQIFISREWVGFGYIREPNYALSKLAIAPPLRQECILDAIAMAISHYSNQES